MSLRRPWEAESIPPDRIGSVTRRLLTLAFNRLFIPLP